MSFAAAVTLTLILDESGMCAVALFCCIVHEAGHIICLLFLGEKPALIEFSFYGIKLERVNGVRNIAASDLAVYLSGPSANFIFSAALFLLSNFYNPLRIMAIISFGIGLFNLIPCKPLDGGNIIYALLCRNMCIEVAEKICFVLTLLMLLPMGFSGAYLLIRNGNVTLLTVTAYLAAATFFEHK